MIKKKLMPVLVVLAYLSVLGVQVEASEVTVSGSSGVTAESATSFVVDSSILGGDLIVSVPAEIGLTYKSSQEKFTGGDVISAKGGLESSKKLTIKAPLSINYNNSSGKTALGNVVFGNNGTESWSSAELLQGTVTPVTKPINITVNKGSITDLGTYSTRVTYYINVENI